MQSDVTETQCSPQKHPAHKTHVVRLSSFNMAFFFTDIFQVVIAREAGDYTVATSMIPPELCQVHEWVFFCAKWDISSLIHYIEILNPYGQLVIPFKRRSSSIVRFLLLLEKMNLHKLLRRHSVELQGTRVLWRRFLGFSIFFWSWTDSTSFCDMSSNIQ